MRNICAMLKNAHGRLSPPPRCCLSVCCKQKGGLLSSSGAADALIWGCLTILCLCLPQALGTAQVDGCCRWLVRVLMRCSVVSVDPVLQSAATSGYWVSDGIFCFLLAHSFQIVWYVITMCASSCQNRTFMKMALVTTAGLFDQTDLVVFLPL